VKQDREHDEDADFVYPYQWRRWFYPTLAAIALWFVLIFFFGWMLSGCTTVNYSQKCTLKDGTTSETTVQDNGFAFIRSLDDVDITSTACGNAHIAGAKTDAEKGFEAGLQAGKEIAGAAAGGPAGAAAVKMLK
jgi:hypothetical protein